MMITRGIRVEGMTLSFKSLTEATTFRVPKQCPSLSQSIVGKDISAPSFASAITADATTRISPLCSFLDRSTLLIDSKLLFSENDSLFAIRYLMLSSHIHDHYSIAGWLYAY